MLDMGSILSWQYYARKDEADGMLHGFEQWYYGFSSSLEPQYVACCFDAGHDRRKAIDPEYKIGRVAKEKDEAMIDQFRRAPEFIASLGLQCIKIGGEEADDVIASIVSRVASEDTEVVVASTDKDLAQLCRPGVLIYDPKPTAEGKYRFWDASTIKQRMDVDPWRIVDLLAMAGDSSDDIKGIKGIGDKYAKVAIRQTRSMAELFRRAAAGELKDLSPATQNKIVDGRAEYDHAFALAQLYRGLDVPSEIEAYRIQAPSARAERASA